MQSRRLDLQPTLMRARMLGEDLEDHLGAVEYACFELELEVALLPRAEVVVADDEVEGALQLELAQRIDLAHADEMRRVDLSTPLYVRADDFRARRACEVGELRHLHAHELGGRARQHYPDKVSPLSRRPGMDQSLSRLSRASASSKRESEAVTD